MIGRSSHGSDGKPPCMPLFLSEPHRAISEYGLFLASGPFLRSLPHGDGHPVLVLPGLLGDDRSTRPMRRVLKDLGYQVHGWRLGRNIGPTEKISRGVGERLDELNQRHGRAVSLLGWSLGGIYARELSRETPAAVRQVITMGTAFKIARRSESRAYRVFDLFADRHAVRRELPLERGLGPLPVPATSIYSKQDGINSWRACLDDPSPLSENVGVAGSHCGLGFNPAVIWVVADRLAQPEGQWAPFRSPALLRPVYPTPERAVPRPTGGGVSEAAA